MRRAENLTNSFADCLEIWEPQPPGTLKACPGLKWDCFYVYIYVWILRKIIIIILSQNKQSPECDFRVRPLKHKAQKLPIESQKPLI